MDAEDTRTTSWPRRASPASCAASSRRWRERRRRAGAASPSAPPRHRPRSRRDRRRRPRRRRPGRRLRPAARRRRPVAEPPLPAKSVYPTRRRRQTSGHDEAAMLKSPTSSAVATNGKVRGYLRQADHRGPPSARDARGGRRRPERARPAGATRSLSTSPTASPRSASSRSGGPAAVPAGRTRTASNVEQRCGRGRQHHHDDDSS